MLLHKDLTREMIGAGMRVHRELGPGWDEWDYHRAMVRSLEEKGLTVASKARRHVTHRGRVVDTFEADLIVGGCVIAEFKHQRHGFAPQNFAQVINYLKAWQLDLGLLMNYGLQSFFYRRVPYTERSSILARASSRKKLNAHQRDMVESVTDICDAVRSMHGLGYGAKTCQALVKAEAEHRGLKVTEPIIELTFDGLSLGERWVNVLNIEGKGLAYVIALYDTVPAAEAASLRSYLKHFGQDVGVLANFGKEALTIHPVTI